VAVGPEVEAFVALGALPSEQSDQPLELYREHFDRVTRPVSNEEAELLVGVFGSDDCFGFAWSVLHLIETAPGRCPVKRHPASYDNEWLVRIWGRYAREPLVTALRRWCSTNCDRLTETGITTQYVESPHAYDHAAQDRSAVVDLSTDLAIGRATVWNRGFCDLELLSIPTGEQILSRHHEDVGGINLWALLDDLARRMAMR
jgi:hypothetical protein